METLLKKVLQQAVEMGADYADVRFCSQKKESIQVKNSEVLGVDFHTDYGCGLRVLLDGSWGFASNPDIESEEKMLTMVERAVEQAKAAASVSPVKMELAKKEIYEDSWKSDYKKDPFEVPLEEKIELLIGCCDQMKAVDGVAITKGSMDFWREDRFYMDTEGSRIEQQVTHSGGGISCMSLNGGEVHERSYPSTFRGNHRMEGWEFIEELDFLSHAKRLGEEVVKLHSAMVCPDETMDLIIGGSQLVLQVHESCGHAVELDRVLGYEANFAGTSFLNPDMRGNYQYGSEIVNLYQDGTIPNSIGSSKYDDEGVKCTKTPIVENGVFVGFLKSRDTAQIEDGTSNGCGKAQGWRHVPIVRMTGVHLAPGNETLEELISSTKRGILMTDNNSWSIDDKRWNFQFGCEVGWLIEDGKITEMVKKPNYTGTTKEFWNSCVGIANKDEWKMWGTPHCGKGQPMQVMRVGHGVSYAKFKNIRVGVSK
jgi:TldD protein